MLVYYVMKLVSKIFVCFPGAWDGLLAMFWEG